MKSVTLPKFLHPNTDEYLIRVGSDYDGGYLIDQRDITQSDLLIGLGINDDWSFEEAFYAQNPVPIYAYDGTISLKVFIKKLIKSIPRIDNPRLLLHWIKVIFKYRRFFTGNKQHIDKLVGMDLEPTFISLRSIFKNVSNLHQAKRVFLKIDIEGWEYRILNEILLLSDSIQGLTIEFHDVDLNMIRIKDFIEKFPLPLVHVHCNNYAIINSNKTPLAIECTFTSSGINTKNYVHKLPNKNDMPNNKTEPDYHINFENT